MSDDNWVVESESVQATFALAGGRLTSLKFRGIEIVKTADPRDDVWWGGFVMAPWAGIIPGAAVDVDGATYPLPKTWGEDALHGLVRNMLLEEHGGGLRTALDHAPFGGEFRLTASAGDDRLDVTLSLRANQRMPSVVGWHPWFARSVAGVEASPIRLAAGARMFENGGWVAPNGGPWDNPFESALPVTVAWPGVGQLAVSSTGPIVGIYNPEPEGFAIEPMTGLPGVPGTVLEPNATLDLTTSLRWEQA